jgi:multiple sugar transport system ATP-binding protein
MTMASRIVVMKDGLIQQVDTPQNLYDYPVNLFVAGFIGTPQMNFIDAKLIGKGDEVIVHWGEEEQKDKPSTICEIKLPADKANDPALKDYIGKEVIIGVRPECLRDDEASLNASPDTVVDANVEVTELMGNEIYLYMNAGEQNLIARVNPRSTTRSGDQVKICIDASRVHIFDKDTEKCIIH